MNRRGEGLDWTAPKQLVLGDRGTATYSSETLDSFRLLPGNLIERLHSWGGSPKFGNFASQNLLLLCSKPLDDRVPGSRELFGSYDEQGVEFGVDLRHVRTLPTPSGLSPK